uniref:Spike protein n=1 Tax=Guangdong mandarin rat snake torovirus TaxID=2116382 RepID=A0A2P1GNJ5_9NIDO|nr:spike protein [Guangdong mandarin rat snake torovirus]
MSLATVLLSFLVIIPLKADIYPNWDKNILAAQNITDIQSDEQLIRILNRPVPHANTFESQKYPQITDFLKQNSLSSIDQENLVTRNQKSYNLYPGTDVTLVNTTFGKLLNYRSGILSPNDLRTLWEYDQKVWYEWGWTAASGLTFEQWRNQRDKQRQQANEQKARERIPTRIPSNTDPTLESLLKTQPNPTITRQGKIYLNPHNQLAIRTSFSNGVWSSQPRSTCPQNVPIVYIDELEQYGQDKFRPVVYAQHQVLSNVRQKLILIDDTTKWTCKTITARCKLLQCTDTRIQAAQQQFAAANTLKALASQNHIDVLKVDCSCPLQCSVFIDADILVTVIDGRVTKTIVGADTISGITQALNNQFYQLQIPLIQKTCQNIYARYQQSNKYEQPTCTDVKTQQLYYVNNIDNTLQANRPSSSNLRSYTYSNSLLLFYQAPLGPLTIPNVYCSIPKSVPRTTVQQQLGQVEAVDYIPPQVVTFAQSRLVDFGFSTEGYRIYGQDPVFLSPSITLRPTEGSCRLSTGFLFTGSFKVIENKDIPFCKPSDYAPVEQVCFSSKLVQKQAVFYQNKNIPLDPVNCKSLCLNPLLCVADEIKSPLMQSCELLATQINTIIGKSDQSLGFSLRNRTSIPTTTTNTTLLFNFIQEVVSFDFKQTKIKAAAISSEMEKFIRLLTPISNKPTNVAPQLGFLSWWDEAQFNSDSDMDKVAALPWLAGYRYGRQINTLNFATQTLIRGLAETIKSTNENFNTVNNALKLISGQTQSNYKSITSLYTTFSSSIQVLANSIQQLQIRVRQVEYMTAKLAGLNQLYTEVKVAQLELKTNIELFKNRVLACRQKQQQCNGGIGPVLYHSEIETPDYYQLIVHYLGEEKCERRFQSSSFCEGNILFVSPYPCIFLGNTSADVLLKKNMVNMTDGSQCTFKPILIQGCNVPQDQVEKAKLFNLYAKDISPSSINFTTVLFEAEIQNITHFNDTLNNYLNSIKVLEPLGKYFTDVANKWFDSINGISGWTFWDYLKWAAIALVVIILLPIILPIINTLLLCCRR